MAGTWKALVLMLGVAVIACAAQRHRLKYEDLVTQAVQVFNYGRPGQPLFRLVEATRPPRSNSTTNRLLSFRIRETVCRSEPGRRPQDCAFRDGGEERNCTGAFARLRRYRILAVDCSAAQGPQLEGIRKKRSADTQIDSSKLPPEVRDMYEKAKQDIIGKILNNF